MICGDRLGRARLGHRRAHLERGHVALEARRLGLGELEVRHAELARLGQDRVVDVGDVAHHAHLVAELLEAADQEVVGEVLRRVPEVRRVVGRDPAHVHPHRVRRVERHDLAPRGVVEAQGHAGTTLAATARWCRSPTTSSDAAGEVGVDLRRRGPRPRGTTESGVAQPVQS